MKQFTKILISLSFIIPFLFYACIPPEMIVDEHYQDDSKYDVSFNTDPNKCYAKCIIPARYIKDTTDYIVYTGDSTKEDIDLIYEVLMVTPPKSQWVKGKPTLDCISDNPDDCRVWCLKKTPSEYLSIEILRDTSATNNYEVQTIISEHLVSQEKTDWREVLCESQITFELRKEIILKLIELDYLVDGEHNEYKYSSSVRTALEQYQIEYYLPKCRLSIQMLDHLEVYY